MIRFNLLIVEVANDVTHSNLKLVFNEKDRSMCV